MTPDIQTILDRYPPAGRDRLIQILQEVQETFGYVPVDAIRAVGRHLSLPPSRIYGVATFYNQFRFQPPGRHHVQVCRGTACHVKGSAAVLEAVERILGIPAGRTTRDGGVSLEEVACIGACGLAPVVKVDDDFHGGITRESVEALVTALRAEEEAHHG